MSYLADPPETPIAIDGGIPYTYVIAQQGAVTMSVDTDADFTFALTPGEPALLTFTYTGTIQDTPQYKTVTVRLTLPGGTVQTHTPQFQILPTSAPRRVPNITTSASLSVAPGQAVTAQVTTDISSTSFAASNLPGTLAVSSTTGFIDGNAPTTSGFYVITLSATGNVTDTGQHYSRYFVLIVGTGGAVVPPPAPGIIGGAGTLFDGDYTSPQVAAPAEYEIPFKEDPRIFGYKIKFWQFIANYLEPQVGDADVNTFGLNGTFIGAVPGSIKPIGGGIIEFIWEYALVPSTRSEYESFVYSYQVLLIGYGFNAPAPPSSIVEVPFSTQSRIQFDYFQTDNPGRDIPLERAPRSMIINGGVYYMNGSYALYQQPTGTEILATDATYKRWKGNIYERQKRYITWISPSDLLAFNG